LDAGAWMSECANRRVAGACLNSGHNGRVQVEQRADQDGDETGHGATSAGELFDSEELR